MKFNEVLVLETKKLTLRVVLSNASVERVGEHDHNLVLTPELIDVEASLDGEIVSFARLIGLGSLGVTNGLTKFPDWSEQELIKPSSDQSSQIVSELSQLLGADQLARRGGTLRDRTARAEMLRILSAFSSEFKCQLQSVIERNVVEEIDLDEVLRSLTLKRQYGYAIPYFGAKSPYEDEYWLRDDYADICCNYEFETNNGLLIDITVRPKHPVSRIPIDNVFDVTIDRASAQIKLDDYHTIKELLVPMITAVSINSTACPRIYVDEGNLVIASGGDQANFNENSTLEERLSELVRSYEEDSEDNEALYLAAQNFQMGFETLHHLWATPCQISALDILSEPSGFHSVNKLCASEFSSSLIALLNRFSHHDDSRF